MTSQSALILLQDFGSVQLKIAMRFMTQAITYDVPNQDLRVSKRQIPALPKSGFIISDVGQATHESDREPQA